MVIIKKTTIFFSSIDWFEKAMFGSTCGQKVFTLNFWILKNLNGFGYHWATYIMTGFRTIFFIFISTTFQPICPLAFFRCLSNSGTYMELRTMSYIEITGVTCSGYVSHYPVRVLNIPVLLLACNQDWTCIFLTIVSFKA